VSAVLVDREKCRVFSDEIVIAMVAGKEFCPRVNRMWDIWSSEGGIRRASSYSTQRRKDAKAVVRKERAARSLIRPTTWNTRQG
jgi:hypothetical protein